VVSRHRADRELPDFEIVRLARLSRQLHLCHLFPHRFQLLMPAATDRASLLRKGDRAMESQS
jgi:hypothetical protein